MTTLALPPRSVKTSRTAAESRPATLARALGTALRGLESLIPAFHGSDVPANSPARDAWLSKVWWPTNKTLDRAEKAMLDDLRRRGVAGAAVGGRLYLDLTRCLDDMGDLTEYRGTNVPTSRGCPMPGKASRRRRWSRRRAEVRALLMNLRRGGACRLCGEDDPVVLDFHHLDPAAKAFTVGGRTRRSVSAVAAEVAKCALVCANCHRRINAGSIDASGLLPLALPGAALQAAAP